VGGGQDCMCGSDACTCYNFHYEDNEPIRRGILTPEFDIKIRVNGRYIEITEKQKIIMADLVYDIVKGFVGR